MKRLMTIFFILAIFNIANAGMVDIWISSLNGEPITPTQEITITPTDEINFDIVYELNNDGSEEGWVFTLSKILLVDGPGALDISQLTYPDGYWDMNFTEVTPDTENPGSALIGAVASDIDTVPPGIILDHFLIHCDEPGDVFLTLVETERIYPHESLETDLSHIYPLVSGLGVIIHQIPEPMTLTLLGLGALLLRRKGIGKG